jgi:hypothetical protein
LLGASIIVVAALVFNNGDRKVRYPNTGFWFRLANYCFAA